MRNDLRARHVHVRHAHHPPTHRFTGSEYVEGDRRHVRPIHIVHLTRRHVGHIRIHPLAILASVMVPGVIRLPRPQREPTLYAAPPDTHEDNQRRSVTRTLHDAARRPHPAVVPGHPAAVVKRHVAPGRVVHPRPAPGIDPRPMPRAVGHPVRLDPCGIPHRTVVRHSLPRARAVQLIVAWHVTADVLSRHGRSERLVAPRAPAIEVVGHRWRDAGHTNRVGAREL